MSIRSIEINGNKLTREQIIVRELSFTTGTLILSEEAEQIRQENRDFLLNMGLFSSVVIHFLPANNTGDVIDVSIDLMENWYIFPAPILSVGSRSLSSVFTDGSSLDKINLGAKIYHLNLSGRNDYFKAAVQFGYTQNFQIKYRLPYFNDKQTWGIEAEISLSKEKEVAYNTVSNHLVYLETGGNNMFQKFKTDLTFTHRPKRHSYHSMGISYQRFGVADSVLDLNPKFFTNTSTKQRFLSFHYRFILDKRDRIPVATTGHRFRLSFRKEGLGFSKGVNHSTLELEYQKYFPITDRLSAYIIPRARVHLTRNAAPYYFNTALGYGENQLRGYESYVIDGMDYFYTKSGFQFQLYKTALALGKTMPIDKLRSIPIHVYLGFNMDSGVVHDPSFGYLNGFDGELLVGFGPSIQFLFFERFLLSVDYNFNHLRESGLYLHGGFNL